MTKLDKLAEKQVSKIVQYQDFFKTRKGKEIMYGLCKYANYFSDPESLEPQELAFSAGKKSVINYILTKLNQDPTVLLEEFRKRQKEELSYGN